MLRGILGALAGDDGVHPDDADSIDYIMTRRPCDVEPKEQYEKLTEYCGLVAVLFPDEGYVDPSSPSVGSGTASLEEKLDDVYGSQADSESGVSAGDLLSPAFSQPTTPSPLAPPSAVPQSASPAGPPASPAAREGKGKATARLGRPPVKAAAGLEAQALVRKSERLRGRHKLKEAEQLLEARLEAEGATITSPYAAKQAKALATQLYVTAGGFANASKVAEKLAKLPEVRAFDTFDEDGDRRRGKLIYMRLLLKWSDGCGVQYVQREAALGTAALYGDIEALAKEMAIDEAVKFGVIGTHVVFEPHCFKYIHDAAGKVFVDNKNKGVMGRNVTISDIEQHHDHNAATMLAPVTEDFNFDFSFSNYIHVLYKKENFINLEADAVEGIKSWRFTQGGTDERAAARGGHGTGGLGYSFRSQRHICFCEGSPCKHVDFTGSEHGCGDEHKVRACKQEKTDREQATGFVGTIKAGMPLASKGDLEDATAGGEPLWLSISKGEIEKNDKPFKDASGRTICMNWSFVDVKYLVKIKTDAEGNVHYEEWTQPDGERTVLTKPKILTVKFKWLDVKERRNAATRFILSAVDYARLTDVVKPRV